MSLVIDTSVLISLENGNKDVAKKLENIRVEHTGSPSVTFINYFEFLYGINERNPKNKSEAVSFLELFNFLPPTKTTAGILNDLKYKYDKSGNVFSMSDLLVASQTMENNMTLVTTDKKFREIEGLKKIIL